MFLETLVLLLEALVTLSITFGNDKGTNFMEKSHCQLILLGEARNEPRPTALAEDAPLPIFHVEHLDTRKPARRVSKSPRRESPKLFPPLRGR